MNYENILLKGVTRKPDDSLSSNGELAVALDLVHDGDGLRTGEQPTQLFTTEGKSVIFIHQNAGYKHYISYAIANNVTTLYYRVGTSGADTAIHTLTGGITAISSVGNTIIVNDGTGLNYILWDASQQTYRFLGQKPPFINIRFGLISEFCCYPETSSIAPVLEFSIDEREVPIPTYLQNNWVVPPKPLANSSFHSFTFSMEHLQGNSGEGPVAGVIENITQWTMAQVNPFITKMGTEKNRFIFPFFVRYCYEMYDGSHIMHSYPTLMIPNSKGPVLGLFGGKNSSSQEYYGLKLNDNDNYQIGVGFRGRVYGFAADLQYQYSNLDTTELLKWKDVIKSVSVFVTPPIYTHKQDERVYGWTNMDAPNAWDSYFSVSRTNRSHFPVGQGDTTHYIFHSFKNEFMNDTRVGEENDAEHQSYSFFMPWGNDTTYHYPSYIMTLPLKNEEELRQSIVTSGQFFKIAELKIEELESSKSTKLEIKDNLLKTLTSQQQMQNDYFSNDILASSIHYPYNRRLNIAAPSRIMHTPLPCHIQWQWLNDGDIEGINNTLRTWMIYVYTKTNGVSRVVYNEKGLYNADYQLDQSISFNVIDDKRRAPYFIFVPDPDAYKVVVTNGQFCHEFALEKHDYLNGAYWLGDIQDHLNLVEHQDIPLPVNMTNPSIPLYNLVYTSEAENPFVFTPENVNAVGDGRILALCSNTTMLSHDVFGREPMYVFTEQGVWPMTVGTTGVFSSVQMPTVRDVILPGTKPLPITQSILFLTKRGLLAMNGNSVKVVSEDINNDFLAEFDKLTELVTTIFDASYAAKVNAFTDFRNDSANARLAYDYRNQRVYVALGNGCWVLNLKSTLWTQSSTVIGTPLNSFPDCEFATDNSVYTIGSARKDTGLLLTRPVKTGSEFYANIKEMAARGNFSINDAPVVTALFGTRNFINNYLLKSSTRPRITRFGGSPFKAHSFLAAIKNPSALVNMADKTYIDRFVIGIDTFQRNKLR